MRDLQVFRILLEICWWLMRLIDDSSESFDDSYADSSDILVIHWMTHHSSGLSCWQRASSHVRHTDVHHSYRCIWWSAVLKGLNIHYAASWEVKSSQSCQVNLRNCQHNSELTRGSQNIWESCNCYRWGAAADGGFLFGRTCQENGRSSSEADYSYLARWNQRSLTSYQSGSMHRHDSRAREYWPEPAEGTPVASFAYCPESSCGSWPWGAAGKNSTCCLFPPLHKAFVSSLLK